MFSFIYIYTLSGCVIYIYGYEVRSKLWYTTYVKESSVVSGKCATHCSDRPPKSFKNDTMPIIVHNVHIWSCFAQNYVYARGKTSDTHSDTFVIGLCSKSSPQTTNRPFPPFLFLCVSSFPFLFLFSCFPLPFLFRSFSFPLPFLSRSSSDPFPSLFISFSFPFLFLFLSYFLQNHG